MSNRVTNWLDDIDLGEHAESFTENHIDFDLLTKLSSEDLKDLGLSVGHRRRFLDAVAMLKEPEPEPEQTGVTSTIASGEEAERRQLTVMFCDLADSTQLSQKLDPEDLREINRAYQDACKTAIERYEGYVAKYMGDGVLAYFGYPQAHEDDVERAIHAGLGVVESMVDLRKAATERQGVEQVNVRVGIATGPVVVGDLIGEGASQESAAVGETPNLAARLQTLAEPNTVIVGQLTRELAGGRFIYKDLSLHDLKGLSEPVRAWRVIATAVVESRFEVPSRTSLTPLVGREHEIALLGERWEQAKEGDGQVVLLSGEAGIGKSRVAKELRELTAQEDAISLYYQCSPYHTNSVLQPVIEHVERTAEFDFDELPEVKIGKLRSLLANSFAANEDVVPLFGTLLSIPAEGHYILPDLTPEQQKVKTLDALVLQIEDLSRQKPVLLTFEDAHWSDPTSLDWLGLVIERVQDLPAMLLITFRPEFAPPWTCHSYVTSLSLNRFGRSLANAMVENVTGGKPLPASVHDQIIEKTDGVPLFVEELTKSILESGQLVEEPDQYVLTGPLSYLVVPATLHDSLMARLDRLGPVKEVAQLGAVIGREFSYELLSMVSTMSDKILRDALDQLLRSGLVFRRGMTHKQSFVFKHALVQDAAYESLLKSRLQTLHGNIAKTLTCEFREITETQPEVIAHHYTEARYFEPAVENWLRAGKRAVERCAYDEATSHLNRGLALTENLPDDRSRARKEIALRVSLGVPLMSKEGWAAKAVENNYQSARVLCEKWAENEQLFPVLWGIWINLMMRSKGRLACALADRLLEVGKEQDDSGLQLQAHHCQWTSHFMLGEIHATLEHAQKGIELYDSKQHHQLSYTYGGHDAGVCAHQISSLTLWLDGYPDQSQTHLQAAFDLAQELGHLNTLVEALVIGTVLAAAKRDINQVAEWTERVLATAPGDEYGTYQHWTIGAQGWIESVRGNHQAGTKAMRSAMDTWLKDGVAWTAPMITLAVVEMGRHGSLDEGLEIVGKSLDLIHRDDTPWFEADLHRVRGELLLIRSPNEAEEAENAFHHALEISRAQGAKSLELRAATSLARHWKNHAKGEQARGLLTPVYNWFTEGFDSADLTDSRTLLEELS